MSSFKNFSFSHTQPGCIMFNTYIAKFNHQLITCTPSSTDRSQSRKTLHVGFGNLKACHVYPLTLLANVDKYNAAKSSFLSLLLQYQGLNSGPGTFPLIQFIQFLVVPISYISKVSSYYYSSIYFHYIYYLFFISSHYEIFHSGGYVCQFHYQRLRNLKMLCIDICSIIMWQRVCEHFRVFCLCHFIQLSF